MAVALWLVDVTVLRVDAHILSRQFKVLTIQQHRCPFCRVYGFATSRTNVLKIRSVLNRRLRSRQLRLFDTTSTL